MSTRVAMVARVVWALVVGATLVRAQGRDTTQPVTRPVVTAAPASVTPTAAAPATGPVPSLDSVRVVGVSRLGAPGDTAPTRAGIGEIVVVRVADLLSLVRRAKCLDAHDRDVAGCAKRDIALYLDGREIRGIVPESGAPRANANTLQFHLQRDSASDEAWADLLGAPRPSGPGGVLYRPTQVSVGLTGDYALPTTVQTGERPVRFELVRARTTWLVATLGVLAAIYGLVGWLAVTRGLLRDRAPAGSDTRQAPWSLGRTQMAFWFVVVLSAWVAIWLTTGAWDTLTPSVVGLIGISASTALGAVLIDQNKENRAAQAGVAAPVAPEKQGFLADLLTDDAGYSFHRVQIFAWTLVLGVFFLHQVWARLSMPEFGANLLALMGFSSGTYLGFKLPERQG